MSHLHLPDGVLPTWMWLGGWVLALALIWLTGRADAATQRRRVPLLSVVSALMLVAMSTEIVPIAYHVNLTVVGGVLLGPVLAPLAAFIVVVTLALLGHGGFTVVGLNVLMITAEMVLGSVLFRGAVRVFGRRRVRLSAALATVVTLALTTTLLVGLVAVAGSSATSRETGALDPASLRFENPFSRGVVSQSLFSGGEKPKPASAETGALSVRRFASVVFVLGPFGWALEALITALVLGYVARVRPSLLWTGAPEHHILGDEAGGY